MAFKVDFHIHTYYSYDSMNRPQTIIKIARKRGLDAVVVLDHESIIGGRETARLDTSDILVIPAVEINTDIGDIVGLFVREEITAKEYHQVIAEIKAQGGLVMLPHPYHKHNLPDDIGDVVDLIEINNARALPERNEMAGELAKRCNKPAVSGSDAHFSWEIGNSITIFEQTPASIDELKELILKGDRFHQLIRSNPFGIIFGQLLKYRRRPSKILERLGKLFGWKK